MSAPATAITPPADVAASSATGPAPGPGGGLARQARETWILTRRSLARFRNGVAGDTSLDAGDLAVLGAWAVGGVVVAVRGFRWEPQATAA